MLIDSMPIARILTIGAILLKDFFIINPLHFFVPCTSKSTKFDIIYAIGDILSL